MKAIARVVSGDNSYENLVTRFLAQEFPGLKSTDTEMTLELLSKIVLGTKDVRYGPLPLPESLVAIRSVIRSSVELHKPIPILTPWGGKKAKTGERIDMAEVSAIKQLDALQRKVKEYYEPGIDVHIRLEDTGALYLFNGEGERMIEDVYQYVEDFKNLVNILDLPFISPIAESSMLNLKVYTSVSNEIAKPMFEYLLHTDAYGFDGYEKLESYKELVKLGWKGMVPIVQRDWYRDRYASNYPGISPEESTKKLAHYLAGSLARYKMNGTGADEGWKGQYIRLTFVPPIPGVDKTLVSKDIYYRTIPASMGRTHIAPWRGKGFLCITGEDQIVAKLCSWNEIEGIPFNHSVIELTNGNQTVQVQSDFTLED